MLPMSCCRSPDLRVQAPFGGLRRRRRRAGWPVSTMPLKGAWRPRPLDRRGRRLVVEQGLAEVVPAVGVEVSMVSWTVVPGGRGERMIRRSSTKVWSMPTVSSRPWRCRGCRRCGGRCRSGVRRARYAVTNAPTVAPGLLPLRSAASGMATGGPVNEKVLVVGAVAAGPAISTTPPPASAEHHAGSRRRRWVEVPVLPPMGPLRLSRTATGSPLTTGCPGSLIGHLLGLSLGRRPPRARRRRGRPPTAVPAAAPRSRVSPAAR